MIVNEVFYFIVLVPNIFGLNTALEGTLYDALGAYAIHDVKQLFRLKDRVMIRVGLGSGWG